MNSFIIIGIGLVVIFLIVFIILVWRGMSPKGIEKTLTNLGNATVRAQNNIINDNEEILKNTANKTANINKDAVKVMAQSIKEGFSDNNDVYCKHCGGLIDYDSKFCKSCGKEQ